MLQDSRRIDGWKAIAAHFGRDRTTVMRWARSRDLPVRRVPGGGTSSVYAMSDDLDRWLLGAAEEDRRAPPMAQPRRRWLAAVAVVTVLAVAGGLYATLRLADREAAAKLPADPKTAALYLQARDDWSLRNPDSLRRARAGFSDVVARDPRFAPGHAGLAEAYLLAREFDGLPDEIAYPRAAAAAKAALALDPNLAQAHRALGYIAYWWDRDPRAAGAGFRTALQLAPADAQTHHWYGNILADSGAAAAGVRELTAARLIEPGSPAIQSDLAWAMWYAGDADGAKKLLADVTAAHPNFCSPHFYLSVIAIAGRDYDGYLRETALRGVRCGAPLVVARAAEEAAAYRAGGPGALAARLLAEMDKDRASNARINSVLPVLFLSAAGDRATLVAVLKDAERRGERWGAAGLVDRVAAAWPGDAEIQALIARLRTPAIT